MARKIRVIFDGLEVPGELNNTKTAEAIYKTLPISATTNTWGEEIYFEIPVEPQEESDVEEVEVGTLGYWPPGRAFCIFFGKTPVSTSDKPRAASKVTVVGKISNSPTALQEIENGGMVTIEKA